MANIPIIKDAGIQEANPDTNYGSVEKVEICEPSTPGGSKRLVMGFNLSTIPLGSQVHDANLIIWGAKPRVVGTFGIYPLTMDFEENAVTWKTPWSSGGAQSDFLVSIMVEGIINGTSSTNVDLTPIVKAWINCEVDNCGIIFIAKDEKSPELTTRENQNNPPSLDVVFMPASSSQQVTQGNNLIQILPDSVFKNSNANLKKVFNNLSDAALQLIYSGLNEPAKNVIDNIIGHIDGVGHDFIIDEKERNRIMPLFKAAKDGL